MLLDEMRRPARREETNAPKQPIAATKPPMPEPENMTCESLRHLA